MTFGFEGKNGVRTSKEQDCQEILDVFFSHGHKELDTARVYAEGTTEEVIAPSDPMHRRGTLMSSTVTLEIGSEGCQH